MEGAAMNAMPTAAAAGKIDGGGDLRMNRLGFGVTRIAAGDLGRSARSIRAITLAALSR
jgi:hypothetical protein